MSATASIAIYTYDLINYLNSQNSEQLSFDPAKSDTAMGFGALDGREIGIAMSWSETELAGHIIAPDGTRVLVTDYGKCLFIGQDRRHGLTVEEAYHCAREGVMGLSWSDATPAQ